MHLCHNNRPMETLVPLSGAIHHSSVGLSSSVMREGFLRVGWAQLEDVGEKVTAAVTVAVEAVASWEGKTAEVEEGVVSCMKSERAECLM